jgi:hypothetical protein
MKTLLYTGHDDAYQSLADITLPRMWEYSKLHGMDFKVYAEPLINIPNGIYWTGVCGAMTAFRSGYERAIYLDVDQLVTNMNYDITDQMLNFQHGFHVPKDWGEDAIEDHDFSACCVITHKDSIHLLKEIFVIEPEWRDKPFPEQGPMRHVLQQRMQDISEPIYFHDRKWNKVPDQVCPGKVPEPWQKGDWCAHLTMVDLPRRIEIANEILASL